MSCALAIDIPQSKYRAGDDVAGTVRLVGQHTVRQEVDVGSISIEFNGKSTTMKNWPRIPRTIRLFSFKKTLLIGPKRLHVPSGSSQHTDRNEWTFSFILPFTCDLTEGSSISSSSFFNTDPNQPLPTTFKHDSVQGGSCSIVYELIATLLSPIRDGYYTNDACTTKMEVQLDRARSIEQPIYNFNTKSAAFTHRSLLLLPREERELARRPLTIKEKLKLKTPSTEHLPKAVFTIRVQTPSAAVVGQPLPLLIHIDYDANASTVSPPLFHVKGVSIHLCQETYIADLKSDGETEAVRWTQEIILHETRFEAKRPRLEERLDLRNVMDTAIPHHVTPSFKTFNIARTYSLKVYVRLESAGKEHAVYGDYKRCTLLAGEYDPPTTVDNIESGPMTEAEENDPPPAYDIVAQEAVPKYSQVHPTMHVGLGHAGNDEATISLEAG